MVSEVTDENFEQEVLNSKLPVLVDFFAEWCPPCKQITQVINELSEEFKEKVKILKLNIDKSTTIANKYEIMSIPTIIFFKYGKEVGREIGLKSKEELSAKISELIEKKTNQGRIYVANKYISAFS